MLACFKLEGRRDHRRRVRIPRAGLVAILPGDLPCSRQEAGLSGPARTECRAGISRGSGPEPSPPARSQPPRGRWLFSGPVQGTSVDRVIISEARAAVPVGRSPDAKKNGQYRREPGPIPKVTYWPEISYAALCTRRNNGPGSHTGPEVGPDCERISRSGSVALGVLLLNPRPPLIDRSPALVRAGPRPVCPRCEKF